MHPSPRQQPADGGGMAEIAAALSRLAEGQAGVLRRLDGLEMAAAGGAAAGDADLKETSSDGGMRGAMGGGRRDSRVREASGSGPIYARHIVDPNHLLVSRYVRAHHAPVSPGTWDLYGNKTFDTLAASKGSTLVHEYKALYPMVSYGHDALVELESVVQSLDRDDNSEMAQEPKPSAPRHSW